MSEAHYITLAAALGEIPDPRARRGRSYEWQYLLLLVVGAMMTGEDTLVGIHDWIEWHSTELRTWLCPAKGRVPSLATVRRVVSAAVASQVEVALGHFQAGLEGEQEADGTLITYQGDALRCQALDGKTVCGASAHGQLVHLVSLVRHGSGIVLDEACATVKLHERRVAETLLARNALRDTVTTTDALHTCVGQAKQICAAGGDYLFVVKRNQRTLYENIEAAFTVLPPQGSCDLDFWQYETVTVRHRGHGRTECHQLESTPALNAYLAFPGGAQVIRRTRRVTDHTTQQQTVSHEYLITSLDRSRVSLAQIETCRRGHWTIENQTHYPRDVSFGEDRSQIRSGQAPQIMAAFRNAVVVLLRLEGWHDIAQGFRYCRRSVQITLKLMGAIAT